MRSIYLTTLLAALTLLLLPWSEPAVLQVPVNSKGTTFNETKITKITNVSTAGLGAKRFA